MRDALGGNGTHGRDSSGRFQPGCPGGPGRPKGSENRASIDARCLRRRILDCWNRIDGDRLLDAYARENFGEFLKIVVKLLPPEKFDGYGDESAVMLDPAELEAAVREFLPETKAPAAWPPGRQM